MEKLPVCFAALISLVTLTAVWHVETRRFKNARISWLFTAFVRGTLILTGILCIICAALCTTNLESFRMVSSSPAEEWRMMVVSVLSFVMLNIFALFLSLGPGGSLGMLTWAVHQKWFNGKRVVLGCGQPEHIESTHLNPISPTIRKGEITALLFLSLLGWLLVFALASTYAWLMAQPLMVSWREVF